MIAIQPSFQLNTATGDRQKLAEAAKQFEAIFTRQMLASARKAGFGDELLGSLGTDTFRQMLDDHFASVMADKGALGLSKTIEAQLARHLDLDGKG